MEPSNRVQRQFVDHTGEIPPDTKISWTSSGDSRVSVSTTPHVDIPADTSASIHKVEINPPGEFQPSASREKLKNVMERIEAEINVLQFLDSLDLEKASKDPEYLRAQVSEALIPMGKLDKVSLFAADVKKILDGFTQKNEFTDASKALSEELKKQVRLAGVFQKANSLEELKKTRSECSDPDKVKEIDAEISQKTKELTEAREENSVMLVEWAPFLAKTTYDTFEPFCHASVFGLSGALGVFSSLATIVGAGIRVKLDAEKAAKHQEVTQDLEPINGGEAVLALLEKRTQAALNKMKTWIESVIKDRTGDIATIKVELEGKGIKLEGENFPKTIEDFKDRLNNDPSFGRGLLKQYVDPVEDKKDTLQTITKNALRDRLKENEKQTQSFLSFKSARSKIFLFFASLASAASIVFTGLGFAGIAFPPFLPLVLVGGISTALMIGIPIVGAFFLRKSKPNLFREVVKGAKADLAINQLPLSFNEWRLEAKKLRYEQNRAMLDFLSAKVVTLQGLREMSKNVDAKNLPRALRPFYETLIAEKTGQLSESKITEKIDYFNLKREAALRELKQEQAELDRVITRYQERYDFYLKKRNALTNRLEAARLADYELATGHRLKETTEQPKKLEIEGVQKSSYPVPGLDTITEFMVKGEFWRDEESLALFEKYTQTKFPKLPDRELTLEEQKDLSLFLEQKIKNRFSRDSSQILKWLLHQ